MSAADVKTNLATTLTATATLIGNRLDDALSPIGTDLAALAPKLPTATLDAAGAGIVTRLGELRTAIASGSLAGTAATVTALNGHLDDLDTARTAFGAQVTPKLTPLLARVEDLDGRLEDALVQIVSAVDPSPTLSVIEPLSKLILDNSAANPITEFQQWLGTFVTWLQELIDALDLSAIKEPLQTASDGAHAILDAFDNAVAGVTVEVQTLFHDVESLVDALDPAAALGGLESGPARLRGDARELARHPLRAGARRGADRRDGGRQRGAAVRPDAGHGRAAGAAHRDRVDPRRRGRGRRGGGRHPQGRATGGRRVSSRRSSTTSSRGSRTSRTSSRASRWRCSPRRCRPRCTPRSPRCRRTCSR